MAKTAFLFPGQGAQSVGMAADVVEQVPRARELFTQAKDILGADLLEICTQGPAERLDSTVISQPALFVAGLAAVEKLRQEDSASVDSAAGAAGLSLGEFTALTFAGVMSFEDGLRVVKVRGQAMQEASDAIRSGMVSVLGLEGEQMKALVEQAGSAGRVWLANYLCPGNTAVSGEVAALDRVEALAGEMGAMKTVRLAVAGAFHTEIMAPAVARLTEVLEKVTLSPPRVPVYSNVDAAPHSDPEEIRGLLIRQVTQPVRWEDSIRKMLDDGFEQFVELGPGRVLAGLLKRISRRTPVINVTV